MKITFNRKVRYRRNEQGPRLVRILSLLKALQDGGVNKLDRAKRYNVHPRTLEADFYALRKAGFKIVNDGYGYWTIDKVGK